MYTLGNLPLAVLILFNALQGGIYKFMQTPLRSAHENDPKTRERPAFQNPYEGHRGLTANEQLVLGEYARLAATVRRVCLSLH